MLEMAVMGRNLIDGSGWTFRNRLDACLFNSVKTVVQDLNLSGPLGIINVQHVTPMQFKCLHEQTATQSRFWQLPFGPRYLAPLHVPPHAPSLELIRRRFKNSLSCLLLFG